MDYNLQYSRTPLYRKNSGIRYRQDEILYRKAGQRSGQDIPIHCPDFLFVPIAAAK